MSQETGKWVIIAGIVIVVVGLVVYFFHDKLHWIGRLPGDIRVERDNFRLYVPITTMILGSLILTALLWLLRRL
jgi:H+/Cl- antiporter ClcA